MRPIWLRQGQTRIGMIQDLRGYDALETGELERINSKSLLAYVAEGLHLSNLAMLSIISPQTNVKLIGGYGTSVAHTHMLAMAFDDPTMDEDLRTALDCPMTNRLTLSEAGQCWAT